MEGVAWAIAIFACIGSFVYRQYSRNPGRFMNNWDNFMANFSRLFDPGGRGSAANDNEPTGDHKAVTEKPIRTLRRPTSRPAMAPGGALSAVRSHQEPAGKNHRDDPVNVLSDENQDDSAPEERLQQQGSDEAGGVKGGSGVSIILTTDTRRIAEAVLYRNTTNPTNPTTPERRRSMISKTWLRDPTETKPDGNATTKAVTPQTSPKTAAIRKNKARSTNRQVKVETGALTIKTIANHCPRKNKRPVRKRKRLPPRPGVQPRPRSLQRLQIDLTASRQHVESRLWQMMEPRDRARMVGPKTRAKKTWWIQRRSGRTQFRRKEPSPR